MTVRELKCDGIAGCAAPVARVCDRGFVYCGPCGERRKASTGRCRKMTRVEIRTLEASGVISYRRRRAPAPFVSILDPRYPAAHGPLGGAS